MTPAPCRVVSLHSADLQNSDSRFKSSGIRTALYSLGAIYGTHIGVFAVHVFKDELPIVYMLICPQIWGKFEKTTEMSKF